MKIATSKAIIGTGLLGVTSIYLASDASAASYTGSSVSVSQFGYNIRVAITTDATGRIIGISTSTPVAPSGQSSTIYSRAVPTLVTEALAAQSANVAGVSGASFTTSAWKNSLASAIAQIVVAPAPIPTPTPPAQTPTPVAVPPTPIVATSTSTPPPSPTSSGQASGQPIASASASPEPSNSACTTVTVLKNTLAEVTSAATPEGVPIAAGAPVVVGIPTPISTTRSGDNRIVTISQSTVQNIIQYVVRTVTKSEIQTQVVTCNYTATPTATPTVTVFVTPTDAPFIIKPGAGVVVKTFTCSKKVGNLTTKKVLKAKVVKCPTGYKLVKK